MAINHKKVLQPITARVLTKRYNIAGGPVIKILNKYTKKLKGKKHKENCYMADINKKEMYIYTKSSENGRFGESFLN